MENPGMFRTFPGKLQTNGLCEPASGMYGKKGPGEANVEYAKMQAGVVRIRCSGSEHPLDARSYSEQSPPKVTVFCADYSEYFWGSPRLSTEIASYNFLDNKKHRR
ncbi:hypothetical protein DQG23_30495 [Paenibacillus contaminans]|uniref:Uncharacterized protein n=1 Tax=Paenibacillus contaminans TaxID=450362 RepID=A0A329M5Z7_9BACL|nr:hypothetical protein DQG23_30495 [Paenibacillus contaminans]